MQQFWYSIKKVQGTDSYEFLLANKKCMANDDVFSTFLDICPSVEGVTFTNVPDDDTTLAFLIKIAIINKSLSGKTASNDKLRKSIIDILWGIQIPPKKSRGKGSQRKKIADDSQETIDVSEESEPEPELTALELGKSISQTEVEEAETARHVHATYLRIVTEYVPKPTKRRKSSKVTSDPPKKLKGVPSLTLEEQEAADIMQALKESKKTSKRQPGTGGSSEGTSTIPGVPDESTIIFPTSSEGTEEKLDVEEKNDKEGNANDEIESGGDDIYKYKIRVRKDENEEMISTEVDDSKKSTVKDTTYAKINLLLEVKIQSEVSHTQSPSMLRVPITLPPLSVSTTPFVPQQTTTPIPTPTIITDAPTITTAVLESSALSDVQLRVAKLEKDVSKLKKIDLSVEALTSLKTQVPSVVDNYLRSKVGDVFQKELKKHTAYLIQKYSLQQIPKLPKKQTPTTDLEQESEKTPSKILKIKKEQAEITLYQTIHANKSFNINPANHRLYHALMEALIEDENAMDKGVADTKPSTTKETPKGKAPSKGSKTGKSASAKEPVEEPIAEVIMDDTSDDVVHDDDQPQDSSEPKTTKTPNLDWFKQPPRPPTPDPEWNKRQVVLDQPEQPWFNEMVYSSKGPLTFDDLMATPINFSKYVLNRLKIDIHTQDILLGPAYNMLKGHPGHLTVTANYFFNNDMEYLKSSDSERMYTTSIMKTKAAWYKIEGIEDVVPTLWSPTKVGYDKDALKGIKH
ncbi:hypothetical protein Tco_0823099 [Tanacetum coccineum]|uniref:Uncharacterized protein n=1 Tax=Tanacetum coccineum TaxID=301880 RepID=A0ABQ5AGY3_9ASTR